MRTEPATAPGQTSPVSSGAAARPLSRAYTRYALGLLVVIYTLNFVDRSILSILLEPIKQEFQVSDTYLGFLSGFAFAAFYTLMGLPIARWADRGSRRSIIALALFVWSAMTAATGLARSFSHLALARIGVGVGEAGCSPPAHSLISDYFPPERRATALAIYSLGIPLGAGIGFLAGGWLNELFDWRTAFIVVGLPGVGLALVTRLTLRDPPRGAFDAPGLPRPASEPFGDVLRYMGGLASFRHMAVAAALHAFYGYGSGAFIAAFFVRSHGLSVAEVGTWMAAILFTGGIAGTFLGGFVSDRLGVLDARWYMWVPAAATALYVPFGIAVYLWPDPHTALLLTLPAGLLGGMYLGPTFAMTQTLVRPRMRAVASAILLFVINIIGLGMGPQAVGVLSDALAPSLGRDSLRYALLGIVVVCAAWSVLHYLLAARTLRDDLRANQPPTPSGR